MDAREESSSIMVLPLVMSCISVRCEVLSLEFSLIAQV